MPNQYAQSAEYGGLVSGMANNHPEVHNQEGYNTFDRSSIFLQTQRFADVNPIYAHKFISCDIAPIESAHDLRTFTLASPLLTNVYMHRSFYAVPLQAIYPYTFQPFFKPQLKGLDFPDAAKPRFPLNRLLGGSSSLLSWLASSDGTGSNESEVLWLNNLFLMIQIFSADGLLAKLGYSFEYSKLGFDLALDEILTTQHGITFQVTRPSDNYSFSFLPCNAATPLSRRRHFMLKLIQNKYQLTGVQYTSSDWSNFVNGIRTVVPAFTQSFSLDANKDCINLEKVIAYQLVCAQFFSNSYVDDINTAKKWLDNEYALVNQLLGGSNYFTLNGIRYNYDLISYYILYRVIEYCFVGSSLNNKNLSCSVLRNIFEIHESLKTSDYFVDSRTQPLAVGDVYASVVSNQVSAIDVNHSLWMQRLLNAVNRIPDNIVEYLRKMFGSDPISKEPQPMFISSERFLVGGQEVENTSDTNQGNTVTLLRSKEPTRYRFEVRVSEPSVIIGVNSYSMDIVYATAMDKEFTEFDRYDNFNPYLQHIGDQPVTQQELCNDLTSTTHLSNFAYQLRYATYKTALNHASGGFADISVGTLKSWAGIYDRTNSANFKVLNSEFIRNANIDFDNFYSSLTGTKMTDYFHFICAFETRCFVNSKQQKFPSLV